MTTPHPLRRVLIMAGGTGGHVFPGLALAKQLMAQGVEVHWMGTERGLESRLVPEAGIPLHLVTIGGLRGKGLKTLLTAPFKVAAATTQSMRIIKATRPDVVVGMGGFVSGPGGVASWLMRCPLVIHEQNARAGLTNKLLKPLAKRILSGFPAAFPEQDKVVVVGNPVRAELTVLPAPAHRLKTASPFRLLVLGGSLGAKAINDVLPRALALLQPEERPIVTHQTGDKLFEQAKKNYDDLALQATLVPFIHDMADAYKQADMVLCRAGALTIAELCAVGLGSILVPYPLAVDDHQTINSSYLVDHQAAIVIQQTALSAERLAQLLKELAQSPEKRLAMAESAYQLRRLRVTETICETLDHVIN